MKEKNKGVVEAFNSNEMDCYYSTSELVQCKKHPSSSYSSSSFGGGGICAYCLKERLVKLVCSDCGEQRLSSCSCSDEITSNRNSCSVEVGSVGRVSFLIENEKNETTPIHHLISKAKDKEEEVVVLRRSRSNCVDIKRNGTFWRIGKLFRKKKKKDFSGRSVGGFDEKSSEMMMWNVDNHQRGVSRSRSLCSFRGGGGGGGLFGSEDGGDSVLSGARSSISAARSSGVNGGLILESGRRSGYSEAEPRRSDFVFECENGRKSEVDYGSYNVVNRRVFSLRESDFKGMDESSFIDLKLDYSSESKQHDLFNAKMGENTLSAFGSIRGAGNFMPHDAEGVLTSGGSCRITVNDRGVKTGRKNMKGWRWIFRYHSNWGGSSRKRDQDLMFKT
ncbi:uncharacterized protein [Cicer arietinum]|uniref:Uncharacterized protein LOC101498006 n=1 Tax=Cicer arietinum TaxID=3827 RepID=A0A1S2XLY5_CICAR|nr:uncharacterized protein LOC101498006 [Cicer arietinum]